MKTLAVLSSLSLLASPCAAAVIEGTVVHSKTHGCNMDYRRYQAFCAGQIEVQAADSKYPKPVVVSFRTPAYDSAGKVHTLPAYGSKVRVQTEVIDGLHTATSLQITDLKYGTEPKAEPGPESWSNEQLSAHLASGFVSDYAKKTKMLLDRGQADLVRKQLTSSHPTNRYLAFWALCEHKAPGFDAEAAAALDDPEPTVRPEAICCLFNQKNFSHADAAAKLLASSHAGSRRTAAMYLGAANAVRHKDRLKLLLDDKDATVRDAAKKALENLK